MDFFKHKLGIFLLLLCVGVMVAAIWFFMFGFYVKEPVSEGTLVKQVEMAEITRWV